MATDYVYGPVPPGYELIYVGKWEVGDLFWSPVTDKWRESVMRVGRSINRANGEPAARKIVSAKPTAESNREGDWGTW